MGLAISFAEPPRCWPSMRSVETSLFSTNADKKLNPASNVKLFSTAAVLDVLGDDYRFKTRLVGATPDESGSVKGGVYLLGSGDPSFLCG